MTDAFKDQERFKQAVGATLRDARLARGVTQEELARAFGVDRVTIARYERGTRTISAPTFLHMLAFLGRELPLGTASPSSLRPESLQVERRDPTTEQIIHLLKEHPELVATVKELFETLEIWSDD